MRKKIILDGLYLLHFCSILIGFWVNPKNAIPICILCPDDMQKLRKYITTQIIFFRRNKIKGTIPLIFQEPNPWNFQNHLIILRCFNDIIEIF